MGHDDERRLDGEIGHQKVGLTHANQIANARSAVAGRPAPIESLQRGGRLRAQFQPKETWGAAPGRQGVRRRHLANGLDEAWARSHDVSQEASGSAMGHQLGAESADRISDGSRRGQHSCGANEDALLDVEDEKADGDGLAETADLEPDECCVPAVRQDDLHFVAGPERSHQSDVSKSFEGERSPRFFHAGAEGQSYVYHAGQDWRSIEVAVKAAAPLGHLEVRRAGRRGERRGTRLESSLREQSQRAGVYTAVRRTRCRLLPTDVPRHRCFGCGRIPVEHKLLAGGCIMNRLTALVLGVAVLIPVSTSAADKLENIKLVWSPTTTLTKLGGIDPTGVVKIKIQLAPLTDARASAELLGENREKKKPVRRVTTQENVPAFVTDKLKKVFSEAGLTVVDSDGDIVLGGELQKYFVEETNDYNGEMRIKFAAKDRSGKELWTGVIIGHANNYGRSYKDENYYETLSNLIVSEAVELFKDSALRLALGPK